MELPPAERSGGAAHAPHPRHARRVSDPSLTRGSRTGVSEIAVGLHQGSALSPFLFAIIIDCLTQEVQREAPWDMLFADDVVVYRNRRDGVEERLELWWERWRTEVRE